MLYIYTNVQIQSVIVFIQLFLKFVSVWSHSRGILLYLSQARTQLVYLSIIFPGLNY